MTDVALYTVALEETDVLLDDLFAELTIGETYFLRRKKKVYPKQRSLTTIPPAQPRVSGHGAQEICATGEEPYTISMMLHDADLSRDANEKGPDLCSRPAYVSRNVERTCNWSCRAYWSKQSNVTLQSGTGRISSPHPVLAPVEFRYLNLIADNFPSPALGAWGMDLILCRNVLIYFDEPSIACVAAKLLDTLTDDSWLFLGASGPDSLRDHPL